jgi:NAD(P)H-hydrate epimerase
VAAGGDIYSIKGDKKFQLLGELIGDHAVLLDGVLGTGIRLPLKKAVAEVLSFASRKVAEMDRVHVVAVDCPSGVDCESGEAAAECIPAELTVTMAAIKKGLLQLPAYDLLGELEMVGIGLGDEGNYPEAWTRIDRFVPDWEWVRQHLPERPRDAHKGTFGTALIVAGSVNYTGAALLAGQAAYRVGAGLVTLAVPYPLHGALAGQFPEATWLLLPHEIGVISEDAAKVLEESLSNATALLFGPGFGLEETTGRFVNHLIGSSPKTRRAGIGFTPQIEKEQNVTKPLPPVVIDADGLKLLSRVAEWDQQLDKPAVLTPHPGEMSVMTGLSKEEIQDDRIYVAEKSAKEWGHVLVLKGAFTVIASPEGMTAVIPIATPALARAGTGDVLAGLIVGLLAQGLETFPAAVVGAWLHAHGGIRAADALGSSAAVLAGDVLMGVVDVLADMG